MQRPSQPATRATKGDTAPVDPVDVDRLLPLPHLTFLILIATAADARYGYDILQEVARQSGHAVNPSIGSLYLALQRLSRQGLIAEVDAPEGDERRRFYQSTPLGRQAASREALRLRELLSVAAERHLIEDAKS